MALLAGAGLAPEVAIVFGEEPDPEQPLTPFATTLHKYWNLDAREVVTRRRGEETLAAEILGATVSFLPFRDAIYRDGRYQSGDRLFGEPAPAEDHLPAAIVAAMALDGMPDPAVRLYAPLGIGRHVDHQHAFAAGLRLARVGWDVWFYEDLPYALADGALESRLAEVSVGLTAAARVGVAATWEAKVAAILAYASQVAAVFGRAGGDGSAADVDGRLRAYAVGIGDGSPAERFWRRRDLG